MKKILALLLALVMVFALAACGSSTTTAAPAATEAPAAAEEPAEEPAAEPAGESAAEPVEIIVFAAASMTESMEKVEAAYEAANPGVDIVYNFDSSGTLKTQIQEGADCDVFISAAQKQMNALDASKDSEANPDGLDFVVEGSRIDLLENIVVLVVPEGNPKAIDSFDSLAQHLKDGDVLMAMGNSDVPVGQYTQKILAYYELDEEALANSGLITYGSNVKEVTTQVSKASVDCGVVYGTDAASAGLDPVDTATEAMVGRAIYPAAVMKCSANPEAAQAFLDYIATGEGRDILDACGFLMLT